MHSTVARCLVVAGLAVLGGVVRGNGLSPSGLRCEYREAPLAVETLTPRLSWQVRSEGRGQRQTAYRILVAGTQARLARDEGDLWDSGSVASDETLHVEYEGVALQSLQACWWKVRVWDRDSVASDWSVPAHWTMGLLEEQDRRAAWISYRDTSAVHADREQLRLPPARHYRKEFAVRKTLKRALAHVSALGLAELHLNGERVGDAYFEPGWADYRKRTYYRTHDVTESIRSGANCLGAIVAEGWYSGYVGYGLLVGYGPNRTGRDFYGKTPALWVQLDLEYSDGTRQSLTTDTSWRVTDQGPIREADLIMGETYDARREMRGWDEVGFADDDWEDAVLAEENGRQEAVFYDNCGARSVDLGFQRPARMQSYAAPPIRVTQELHARGMTEPTPGVWIYDLGQNFAGIIRLKVKGQAGERVQLRYGEMLHSDGRLMTENLRRARATDYYILSGEEDGEVWQPRFTYHGFQYVEVSGLSTRPSHDAVTGLVLHNDIPLVGEFACSDELLTRFWKNTQWTQRANFVEIPTDCPQRDERLGWMGDAQVYVRAASYNADVASFFTKWLDDVSEAQRDFGAYPDYAPYPMGHGEPGKTFGTAWMDAGIICPWTIWQVYADTRVVERHWDSMVRFMDWRQATAKPDGLGVSIGNPWGDWLNVNEATPIEYIDTCYHAWTCSLMAQMAAATGRTLAAEGYQRRFDRVRAAFVAAYVEAGGRLAVDTQTAYVLALWVGLVPSEQVAGAANRLAEKIETQGYRMTTGFLGTKALLPVLSKNGYHDLAVRLFQSRQFPSWGYEVANGANTVWERWDSFTREFGFNGQGGNQNAAMNSFSHYSFGAVTEWMFRHLAGIDTDGPGYRRLLLRPGVPTAASDEGWEPVQWVQASYESPRGHVQVAWRREGRELHYEVEVPANTTALLYLPAEGRASLQVEGQAVGDADGLRLQAVRSGMVELELESGHYRFRSALRR